jgi:hypothetical protein
MLDTFINPLLSADADAIYGAAYGTTSQLRTNWHNGRSSTQPRMRWDVDSTPARLAASAIWAANSGLLGDGERHVGAAAAAGRSAIGLRREVTVREKPDVECGQRERGSLAPGVGHIVCGCLPTRLVP